MKWRSEQFFFFFFLGFMLVLLFILGVFLKSFGLEGVLFDLNYLGFMGWGKISIYLDFMSLIYVFVIFLISFNIYFFSIVYMGGYQKKFNFLWLLIFFCLSMMLVVSAGSWIVFFWGWDLLGVSSFFLIIYYDDSRSASAGYLTFNMNRVGDASMLLVLVIMFVMYTELGECYLMGEGLVGLSLGLMLLLTGFTKSAQFPFSVWLPAAMAAPTPVSSLVHSSTLVTAGVYLLFRLESVIMMGEMFVDILILVSSFTLLMAGMVAMIELDSKKVVALSTLSQLGFMFFCLGLCFPLMAFFHMMTHALFKASLFMVIGGVMFKGLGSQDFRLIGGFLTCSGFLKFLFLCNIFSLVGFPFFSGFCSKDLIIESGVQSEMSFLGILMLLIGVSFTMGYSLRLLMGLAGWKLASNLVGDLSLLKFWVFYPVFSLSLISLGWVGVLMGIIELEVDENLFGGDKIFGLFFLFFGVMIFFVVLSGIFGGFLVSVQSDMWYLSKISIDVINWGWLKGSYYLVQSDTLWLENMIFYSNYIFFSILGFLVNVVRRINLQDLFLFLFVVFFFFCFNYIFF